jgi:hypothetical protein
MTIFVVLEVWYKTFVIILTLIMPETSAIFISESFLDHLFSPLIYLGEKKLC